MPKQITITQIRVFLSSPSDVAEERKIVREVINSFSERARFRDTVKFHIIAWENIPMRGQLTPMEAIKQGLPQPSECDIVVAIFWSRMGMPFTDNDGQKYLSGTHWELLNALSSEQTETLIFQRTE